MTCFTPALHKLKVTDSESMSLNLYNMWGDRSCWRIIAVEVGSPGSCVFSLLWFYLHSKRFYVKPYILSTAFSKPLLLSLRNEKWLKHTLDKSDSPLSLQWTLHRFSLCKLWDDTLDNSIFSTLSLISFLFVFLFFYFFFLSWLFSHAVNSSNANHFKLTIVWHLCWLLSWATHIWD